MPNKSPSPLSSVCPWQFVTATECNKNKCLHLICLVWFEFVYPWWLMNVNILYAFLYLWVTFYIYNLLLGSCLLEMPPPFLNGLLCLSLVVHGTWKYILNRISLLDVITVKVCVYFVSVGFVVVVDSSSYNQKFSFISTR